MIDDKILIKEVGKVFNIKDMTSFDELYNKGYNKEEIDTVKQFIINRIDPISWIKDNIIIKHPAKGYTHFNLYDFQEKTIKLFLKKHLIITLKSRQVGMSTLVQALCLWIAMNYMNYNILIISAGNRQASAFLGKIRYMYSQIKDNQFKLKLTTDNKQTVEFENGSKISAIPATRNAALGESINLLIFDEAAFIKNIEAVYQGAYPTISRAFKSAEGKPYGVIIISTPNGISGTGKFYYEMYTQAINNGNGYTPIKIHWSLVPEYDDKWYEDQCKQMKWNYQMIAAELELSFVSSGNTFIPGQILDTIQIIDPEIKDLENNYWVWERPIKDIPYVLGVDCAYGDHKDYSTIEVIRADNLCQVAEYASNTIRPDHFSNIIIQISKEYNNGLVNIERNTVGKIVIDNILDKTAFMAVNLYRDNNPTDLINNGMVSKNNNIGTLVTGQSRPLILGNMYEIVMNNYIEGFNNTNTNEGDSIRAKFEAMMSGKNKNSIIKKLGIIRSERLLHELLGFITDNNRAANDTDHDDLVMAWSHSLYCYTKSKAYLLKDMVKVLAKSVGADNIAENKETKIEFMKKFANTTLWDKINADALTQYELEEKEEKEINNHTTNKNNSNSLNNIYKTFFGG